MEDDLHITGKIAELGTETRSGHEGAQEGQTVQTVQAKAKVLSSNHARQATNRPCAAVCQVLIRCRHHLHSYERTRWWPLWRAGRGPFCPSTVTLARTGSLVRKLDR